MINAIKEYNDMRRNKRKWKDPIPQSIVELLHRTRRLYLAWWIAHYGIGLCGLVAGTLLTALTSQSAGQMAAAELAGSSSLLALREFSWLIGIIAAVSTSLVTFLGPLHKAERYYSAYHLLEQACLEYIGDDANPKLAKLVSRVMQVRQVLQVIDLDEKVGQS